MIILSAIILFSALDFPIRAFTALPIVLLYSFYTVSSFYPLPFDRRTSFLAVSRPITFILLMAFMFLSAVLSFSFVLFYTVLNFTYFIPLGCLPHLAFIHPVFCSFLRLPPTFLRPQLSFCAFSPSPLTLFSMHIFQCKVCIELIVTKFSHMAYN